MIIITITPFMWSSSPMSCINPFMWSYHLCLASIPSCGHITHMSGITPFTLSSSPMSRITLISHEHHPTLNYSLQNKHRFPLTSSPPTKGKLHQHQLTFLYQIFLQGFEVCHFPSPLAAHQLQKHVHVYVCRCTYVYVCVLCMCVCVCIEHQTLVFGCNAPEQAAYTGSSP